MPASASAPAITRNSICIDADCFAIDESAAAALQQAAVRAAMPAGRSPAGLTGGSAAASRNRWTNSRRRNRASASRLSMTARCMSGAVAAGRVRKFVQWSPMPRCLRFNGGVRFLFDARSRRRQFGMRVRDRFAHRGRGCGGAGSAAADCRRSGFGGQIEVLRRGARGLVALVPADTSIGAWCRVRAGSANGCPRASCPSERSGSCRRRLARGSPSRWRDWLRPEQLANRAATKFTERFDIVYPR